MPINYRDYHPKWSLIRLLINKRANHCCEECGAKNGAIIRRDAQGAGFAYATGCDRLHIAYVQTFPRLSGRKFTLWDALGYLGLTKVILTVAHLDRNRHNNRFWNLKALCQRCHLTHDLPQHVRNRAYGRYHDREHQQTIEFN